MKWLLGSCVAIAMIALANGCASTKGIHCYTDQWNCPGDVFAKPGRQFCSNFCCMGCEHGMCTGDDIKKGAKILVNPNFPDPSGRCEYCPDPVRTKNYDYKCIDQTTIGVRRSSNCRAQGPREVDPNCVKSGRCQKSGNSTIGVPHIGGLAPHVPQPKLQPVVQNPHREQLQPRPHVTSQRPHQTTSSSSSGRSGNRAGGVRISIGYGRGGYNGPYNNRYDSYYQQLGYGTFRGSYGGYGGSRGYGYRPSRSSYGYGGGYRSRGSYGGNSRGGYGYGSNSYGYGRNNTYGGNSYGRNSYGGNQGYNTGYRSSYGLYH